MYRYILESNYDLNVTGIVLVGLHPFLDDEDSVSRHEPLVMDVPLRNKEVQTMVELQRGAWSLLRCSVPLE